MRQAFFALAVSLAMVTAGSSGPSGWHMNATAIEACSCPMFCQCYFNDHPAGHHTATGKQHYCKANLAYKINKGHFNNVKLDGAKFWIATDLGAAFADGEMDWATVYFDRQTTKEQREALAQILPRLFPVKWKSFDTAEANIDTWRFDSESAHAAMDGGKTAEVRLKKSPSISGKPLVLRDLPYWGAPRNDGFVLMKNEVQAYRVGPNAFETKGTNGFMITIDMSSRDFERKGSKAVAGSHD